jgi:hypothetical protein
MKSRLESYLLGILISHIRRLYFANLKSTLEEIFPQAFGVGTGQIASAQRRLWSKASGLLLSNWTAL